MPRGKLIPNPDLTFESIQTGMDADRKRAIRVFQFQKRINEDVKIRSRQSYQEFVEAADKPSGISGIGEDYWNFLENKVERQIRMRS